MANQDMISAFKTSGNEKYPANVEEDQVVGSPDCYWRKAPRSLAQKHRFMRWATTTKLLKPKYCFCGIRS